MVADSQTRSKPLKKTKKERFFGEILPKCGWVGWLIPKQAPNPSKPIQITPKIALFDPNFTFRSPKSHKTPFGAGGLGGPGGPDRPGSPGKSG